MANMMTVQYSIELIRCEARGLVQSGFINRQQPIYSLCQFIPPREWCYMEHELEQHQFLLRDRIGDLVGREDWDNDWGLLTFNKDTRDIARYSYGVEQNIPIGADSRDGSFCLVVWTLVWGAELQITGWLKPDSDPISSLALAQD